MNAAPAAISMPEPAPEPEPVPVPAPRVVEEPVAVVLTPPDPDRPKRGGWWNKLAGRG
jgi:ribonuclease E